MIFSKVSFPWSLLFALKRWSDWNTSLWIIWTPKLLHFHVNTLIKWIDLMHFPKHFFHEERLEVMGMKMPLCFDFFHYLLVVKYQRVIRYGQFWWSWKKSYNWQCAHHLPMKPQTTLSAKSVIIDRPCWRFFLSSGSMLNIIWSITLLYLSALGPSSTFGPCVLRPSTAFSREWCMTVKILKYFEGNGH